MRASQGGYSKRDANDGARVYAWLLKTTQRPGPFGSRAFPSYRGGCHPVTRSEVSSLSTSLGTVHMRGNPSRVQEGDQGDVIVYWLPRPDDGEIGPCQRPFSFATGWSWLGQHTVRCSFVTRTSTIWNDRGTIKPIHPNALYHRWKEACRWAGVPTRILHDFRRTAVRNLERAGVPRSVAMKLTGHKTEAVIRRYAIVCEADLTAGRSSRSSRGH